MSGFAGSCPSLPASLLAAKTGGLSLVFGMLLVSGAAQIILSRFLHHLRAYLPPEVTGVIVAMVGVSLVPLGVMSLCGHHALVTTVALPTEVVTGVTTLCLMFGLQYLGRPRGCAFYAVLVGIVLGYGLAYGLQIFPDTAFPYLESSGLFAIPVPHAPWDLTFDSSLILPFMIAGIASAIKAIGVLSTNQKIDDADWTTPDMTSIRGGVLANGLGCPGKLIGRWHGAIALGQQCRPGHGDRCRQSAYRYRCRRDLYPVCFFARRGGGLCHHADPRQGARF